MRASKRVGRTGRLVEVALDNVLVENEQRLEDLEGVRVRGLLADHVVQVGVRERVLSLKPLERQRRCEMRGLIRSRVYDGAVSKQKRTRNKSAGREHAQ
jgi:hypothetical protein